MSTAGPALPSVIRVANDGVPVVVIRTGRYAMEVACALSPVHFMRAIHEAQERMIAGLARHPDGAYEYLGSVRGGRFEGFLVRGPFHHQHTVEDVSADLGPRFKPPSPPPLDATEEQLRNYLDVVAKFEAAEHARTARTLGEGDEPLVDYVLKAHFRRAHRGGHRIHLADQHEVVAISRAARRST